MTRLKFANSAAIGLGKHVVHNVEELHDALVQVEILQALEQVRIPSNCAEYKNNSSHAKCYFFPFDAKSCSFFGFVLVGRMLALSAIPCMFTAEPEESITPGIGISVPRMAANAGDISGTLRDKLVRLDARSCRLLCS